MKHIICVLTATRAEYGLLKPVIQKLRNDCFFDVRVVVTGAHLSPEFGLTYKEIEKDQIPIDKKIEILLSADTPSAISKSMGLAMIGFADYFDELKPDLLVVLGDRYETLAVCCCAANQRIPIAHLHGGETTEGAVDESYRHAITKLSYLHFASIEAYSKRIIQLGEDPERVFTVGSLGVENILQQPLITKDELEKSLNFSFRNPYVVVTYHPVTLEDESSQLAFKALLDVLEQYPKLGVLFTKVNADSNGRIINTMIDAFVSNHPQTKAVTSLGSQRYLSTVLYSIAVIGNSSSGVIEVPSLHVPTVNIGDRQKGRLMADSVINCEANVESIKDALDIALSEEFQDKVANVVNPYEGINVSSAIVNVIKNYLDNEDFNLKKKFYDISF